MIRKAVVPAAGLGTRLMFATKEQPKEMLPVYAVNRNNQLRLKPLIQLVFEQLCDAGLKELCFVVGRGTRIVEDFFTPDEDFIGYLKVKKKFELARELRQFYQKVNDSVILFVNQPEPKGFGHAIYKAKPFVGQETFVVHAGDDLIISKNSNYLLRLIESFRKYEADVAFYVERTQHPKEYGVIAGRKVDKRVYKVEKVVEKPLTPPSNMAIVAIYVLTPKIFEAIEETRPDENNEIQLTDAIQQLVDQEYKVYAVELKQDEKRIDVGTPESYWKALTMTHKLIQTRFASRKNV